jgi:sortase A
MGRQSRVSIMAAHRDTHFAFLKQAKKGDTIDVQSIDGRTRRYRITGFQIVRWDRFAYPRDPARPLLALTTCYPFGATGHGPLRYVAWAEET